MRLHLKKIFLISSLFLAVFLVQSLAVSPSPVQADDSGTENNINAGLCLPGDAGLYSGNDCQMAGPAQRLTDYASQGLTFPPTPIFASFVPAELGNVNKTYARMVDGVVPVYATVEDILAEHPTGKLPAGRTKYVSLYDKIETETGLYYQISNKKWVSREFVSKVGVQFFEGFIFNETPTVSFGWVLDEAETRTGPSFSAALTGKQYHRYDIVQAYDSVMESEVEWVMIGPDEWINHRSLARFIPNNEKPETVKADRWIEINLYEQVLMVHEGDEIIFATLVATGVDPFFTQPGVFQVYKMIEFEYMRGSFEADRSDYYYLEDVPYIMYFDQARALHGAYWHTLFGYQRSHGCVNLSIADSHWLYDWAKMGEYVYVWDPSGKTPTDPSFYGAGGF